MYRIMTVLKRSFCVRESNFIVCLLWQNETQEKNLNDADTHILRQEAKMDPPTVPVLFTKPRTSLSGPYPATISIPKFAQDGSSDYEAELCVVIGKTGKDIPKEKASEYILGYTCSNDVSARKMQTLTSQWGFSKGLDGSCPLGK